LKKLDIYIIRKFLGTFFYAIALIISISVVFDYSEKIDDFIQKQAPWSAIIFQYYLNFIPYFANLFSFLFTFIAVIFFTSKLSVRSEIIAILSSGISFNRLLRPYFISAFVIAVFTFILTNFIIPPANRTRLAFEDRYVNNVYVNSEKNIHKQLQPGVFVYMEGFNTLANVGYKFAIEKFEKGRLVSKITTDYIDWDSTKNKWTMHNCYIRELDSLSEKISTKATIDTALNMSPSEFKRRATIVETMDYVQLNHFIEAERNRGAENITNFELEKHKRFAAPYAVFVLTVMGVSVSIRRNRGGVGGHIGLGILLSFTYILFMQVAAQVAIKGGFSPILAAWIPNIIYTIIAIILYRMTPK